MIQGKFIRNVLATRKSVDQLGFVDVVKIMNTNSLPATTADGADSFNGIDDPSSILGKPTDVFDAMAMQSAINDYKPEDASSKDPQD